MTNLLGDPREPFVPITRSKKEKYSSRGSSISSSLSKQNGGSRWGRSDNWGYGLQKSSYPQFPRTKKGKRQRIKWKKQIAESNKKTRNLMLKKVLGTDKQSRLAKRIDSWGE